MTQAGIETTYAGMQVTCAGTCGSDMFLAGNAEMHLLWRLLNASTHLFVFCHCRAHPVQISLHCSDLLVVRNVHEPKLLVLQCSDEEI